MAAKSLNSTSDCAPCYKFCNARSSAYQNPRSGGQGWRKQMLASVKEQIALIVAAILLLMIWSSVKVAQHIPHFDLALDSLVSGVFVYSLFVLYDTAKSIVVIVDYSPDGGE